MSDNRTQLAAAMIKVFEGCRLTPYRDAVGVLTVGYGHTGLGIVEGVAITQAQADTFLQADMVPLLALVEDKPTVPASALVSFGFNLGIRTLVQVLATNESLLPYCHAGGKVLPGLVARRALEQALIDATEEKTL